VLTSEPDGGEGSGGYNSKPTPWMMNYDGQRRKHLYSISFVMIGQPTSAGNRTGRLRKQVRRYLFRWLARRPIQMLFENKHRGKRQHVNVAWVYINHLKSRQPSLIYRALMFRLLSRTSMEMCTVSLKHKTDARCTHCIQTCFLECH